MNPKTASSSHIEGNDGEGSDDDEADKQMEEMIRRDIQESVRRGIQEMHVFSPSSSPSLD